MEGNVIEESMMESNETEVQKVTALEIASMYGSSIIVRRWAATVIDSIAIGVFYLLALFSIDGLEGIGSKSIIYIPSIGMAVVWLLHYLMIESLTGYTLGKLILRIRVVNNEFNPPGVLKGTLRTILRLVEINPLLFGGIPALIIALCSKSKQRLGDIVAGTYVMEVRDITSEKKKLVLNDLNKTLIIIFLFVSAVVFGIGMYGSVKTISNSDTNLFHREEVLYSKDGKYQLDLPSGWNEFPNKNSNEDANEDANISALNILKSSFLVVVSEDKSNYPENTNIDLFAMVAKAIVIENMFSDGKIIKDITSVENINGYPAKQMEVEFNYEGEQCFGLVTFLETPKGYHQLIGWMPLEKYKENNTLAEIMTCFKEKEELK